ncbi:MAG: 4-(cytidine 5'-diphospho)-2-C-methyl-D-erythritol kinase [Coprobacillus sp.]|nr:4-(cytidine 5'-diphospho)-2-C-methyl-D-erythritol kinase [Coprobacillus sp.]
MVVKSYSKINIALNVVGKADLGYHEIDTIMVPLELHDSAMITKVKGGKDNFITVDDFTVGPVKYNLVTFAIDAMSTKYKFDDKFRIFLHKVVPMEAGLGGGSSNAAAIITGVNDYLKLGIPKEELIELGRTLGSDIPFFISGVPARVGGTGEKITPITIKNNYYCLIVKPEAGLSTKNVYELADEMELKTCDMDKVIEALETGDDDLLADSICNSLQDASIKLCPMIRVIIESLKADGLKIVQMTGSGSAVFALSTDKRLLNKLAKKYEQDYRVELTKVRK